MTRHQLLSSNKLKQATIAGKLLLIWLLVTTCCWQSTFVNASKNAQIKVYSAHSSYPHLNEFSRHSVIRPEIRHGRHKRTLRSTLDAEDGQHVTHITLMYQHEGQRVQIDLHRNDELLPAEHFLRYQNSQTPTGRVIKNFTKTEMELCHYQGIIRGKPHSNVAISTCNGGGINGVVFDGIDTYFIHSGSDGRLHDDHFLFRHVDLLNKNATCGYDATTDDHAHIHENFKAENLLNESNEPPQVPIHFDGSEFNRFLRYKRSYGNNDEIRAPYNANKNSSYVELVFVVDNKVYKSFGENLRKVHQHCKDLANIVNALYVPLNIFIALVGVVIWNEYNEIEFSSDSDLTLRNFLNYRRTKLALDHPNDHAHLLTKEHFSRAVVGKAFLGPICTHEYSGGVSKEHSQIVALVAATIAHEIGHNFGMEHDSADCRCQDEKCIMSATSTSVVPVHWSSCSIDQLNIAFSRGMNYCLRNKPTKLFESPQCGNGFVEPGEQCDCGLPNYCENTCCDPYTCMLHTNASCATGECCDLSTCRPKAAGQACRVTENECDLPEFCTGESEYCPADVFKRDTEECASGQAYCFEGNCRSHAQQCRMLWGPTGESSDHCYSKNTEGKQGGNCGFDRINNTFIRCEDEHVRCGMLHCRHLNERWKIGIGFEAVMSYSFNYHGRNIVSCSTALLDFGLQSTDPGLTPNGAKCGDDKMCVNQKCLTIERVRATGIGKQCPDDCNGNGICNSLGNCHCHVGYAGTACRMPGPGGSINSRPATSSSSHKIFQNFIYIFFLGVIPFMALIIWLSYYVRNRRCFFGVKLVENMYVSTPHKSICSFTTSTSNTTTSSHSSNTCSNLSSSSTASCASSASAHKKLKGTTLGSCAKKRSQQPLKHSNTFNTTSTQAYAYTSTNTATTITTTTATNALKTHSSSTNNLARIHNNLYLTKSKTNEDFNIIKPSNKIVSVADIKKNFTQNSLSRPIKSAATPTKIPVVPVSNTYMATPTTTLKRKLKTPATATATTLSARDRQQQLLANSDISGNTSQNNTLRRKLEITDIRLQATTNPNALCDGAEFIASDRDRFVQTLMKKGNLK